MSDNQFFDRFYLLCRQHGTSPNAVGRVIGASSGSITAWKRGVVPRAGMVNAIADYFGVSVDYLLGYNVEASPKGRDITDAELKFALFGGDREISDEMLAEVRQFAEFLKHRK